MADKDSDRELAQAGPLTGPPTAEQAKAMRECYVRWGSLKSVCIEFYPGVSGRYMQWVREAVRPPIPE